MVCTFWKEEWGSCSELVLLVYFQSQRDFSPLKAIHMIFAFCSEIYRFVSSFSSYNDSFCFFGGVLGTAQEK